MIGVNTAQSQSKDAGLQDIIRGIDDGQASCAKRERDRAIAKTHLSSESRVPPDVFRTLDKRHGHGRFLGLEANCTAAGKQLWSAERHFFLKKPGRPRTKSLAF